MARRATRGRRRWPPTGLMFAGLALCVAGCPGSFPSYPLPDAAPMIEPPDGAPPLPPLDATPDRAPPDAAPPDATPDGAPPDAAPPPPDAEPPDLRPPEVPEDCDGDDDDGDGRVDEAPVCGPYIESRCTVAVAWSDRLVNSGLRADNYAACVGGDTVDLEFRQCRRTTGDGRFRALALPRANEDGDYIGLRFACDDPLDPALAGWFERHCTVSLGHAAFDPGPVDTFGPCPGGAGEVGGQWCLPTPADGQFSEARGPVFEAGQAAVVRFACDDPFEPERAAAATASAAVYLGWSDLCPVDRTVFWGDCPAAEFDGVDGTRCASTAGDGRFHGLITTAGFGVGGCMGIALRGR